MKNLSIILLLVIIVVVVIVFVNLSPHPLSTVVLNSMSASETPQLIVPSVDKQTVSGKKCPRLDNGGWWEAEQYFKITAQTYLADCATFVVFSGTYAKDANAVYFFAHSTTSPVVTALIIEGADPASFAARAWAPFATDKQHVFFLDKLIPDADPATFFHVDPEELPSYFFYYYYRDVNAVYALTADAKDLVRLQDANPKTFRILRGEESIAKDDNRVYAAGKEMTNIDAKTFTFLSGELYKDVDKVFHHDPLTKQLTEMTTTNDVATLRAALKTQFPDSPAYMIDVNGVYYAGRKIHGADPETFELLDSNKREDGYGGLIGDINRYARDKTNVYYHGVIIAGADAKTFQLISTGGSTDEFGKDAKHVFYLSSMIEEANPSTFTPLTFQIKEGCRPGPYSKDAQHVFFGVHLIKDADHDSFMVDEWGSGPYGRDKMHVFESGVLRADLDVKNFSSPCNYG